MNQMILSFNHLAWRVPGFGREPGIRSGHVDGSGSQILRHVKEGFVVDACSFEKFDK